MTRIEIIAIGNDKKIYGVGSIILNKNGDVYLVHKAMRTDFHTSRHSDGIIHWKSRKLNIKMPLGKSIPIKNFKGIEFLCCQAFNVGSLPQLFSEHKLKKSDGVFAIDLRKYTVGTFNLQICILTEEGLSSLFNIKYMNKRQMYLYIDSTPIIGVIAGVA